MEKIKKYLEKIKKSLVANGVALLFAVLPIVLGLAIWIGGRYKKVEAFLKRIKAYLERRKLWIK